MQSLMESIRWIHIIAGFTGLAAFWVPIFTRKGGKNHRLFGKIFKYSAYVVLFGAMIAVVLHTVTGLSAGEGPRQAPNSFAFLMFLAYLAVVTLVGLRHGVLVLEHKRDLADMNIATNRMMAWLAIVASVALIGYTLYFSPPNKIILYALSPIGLGIGSGILKAIGGKRKQSKAWFYEHMGNMMGTGIAFHTAFAVFGVSRLFEFSLSGWSAIIPWILPAAIGIPAINIWTRHYRRKFGDLPA